MLQSLRGRVLRRLTPPIPCPCIWACIVNEGDSFHLFPGLERLEQSRTSEAWTEWLSSTRRGPIKGVYRSHCCRSQFYKLPHTSFNDSPLLGLLWVSSVLFSLHHSPVPDPPSLFLASSSSSSLFTGLHVLYRAPLHFPAYHRASVCMHVCVFACRNPPFSH